MEHTIADPLGTGRRRVVVTGAGGQLGRALVEAFAGDDVVALGHSDWDVTRPAPKGLEAGLVLHAAAWTDVDAAEGDPQGAAAVNVGGTANAAGLGAPLVYFSSDYVFDGRKGAPYVESDPPNPLSAYGRSKAHGEAAAGEDAWIVRSSWLFGPHGRCFPATILERAAERDELAVVDDQVGSPTFTGHLAKGLLELVSSRPPAGTIHVAGEGSCSWFELAGAVVELAGVDCRIKPARTADMARPAPRPAYSVLASELPQAPRLPNWRQGLEDFLAVRV